MNYYYLIALLTINIGFITIASENQIKPFNPHLSIRNDSLKTTNEYIDELINSKNAKEITEYVKYIKNQTSCSLNRAKVLMNTQGYPTMRNDILSDFIDYTQIRVMSGTMIEDMEAIKMLVIEKNQSFLPLLDNIPYWKNQKLTDHEFLKHYRQSINEATPGEYLKKLEQKQQSQKQQSMKFSIIALALTMLAIVNYNKIIELLKNYIG